MSTAFSVSVNIGGKLSPSLATAVNAAKAQVNALGTSLTGIGSRLNAPFLAAQKQIAATEKRLANMQRTGRNATFGVTMPAGMIGASLVKGAVDFEKALNMSEALGDLPGTERSNLEKIAQDLAKRYDAGGATGIVKTTTELMKAGLTFEQARGSLEQVLATSAVSGDMPPADVGASLSKSLAQFQMPIATLGQVTKSAQLVTDRMTYAAVSTVASMRDISESFKYAGGVMSATGNTLDQTTALVMSFAKAGVLGSEAGVALRSALVRLVKMPKGGLAALERIGMRLSDYTSARPVTAKGIVGGLQAGGIDASKIEKQIGGIIKANGQRGPAALGAAITKAVQGHLGSSSAIDASTIAESVNASITAAGSKIDVTKFFTDLKAKLDSGAATMGDIAQILEARHISRYMALLKDDLPALVSKVNKEADGYALERYATVMKGLPRDVLNLSASFDQLQKSIVKVVTPELSSMFERIAGMFDRVSNTNPALVKLVVGLGAAAAVVGPALFLVATGAKLATGALRGVLVVTALLLAPFRKLAVALLAIPAATRGLAAAATAIRAFVAATAALRFSTIALVGLAAVLPAIRRAALGLLIFSGIGIAIAAVVAALAALGVWIKNNWDGIKNFLGGSGEGFMAGLRSAGPQTKALADSLGSMFEWLSKLTGELGLTNEQWREWGGSVGFAAAEGVNKIVEAITWLIDKFKGAIEMAKSLGSVVRDWGAGDGGGAAVNVKPNTPAARVFGKRNAVPLAGARALGGPVSFGKPYLVGERGPELFVPGTTGRIENNDRLRKLTADGVAAVVRTEASTVRSANVNFSPTFNITGGNPHETAAQVRTEMRRFMAELESEQRGFLSD